MMISFTSCNIPGTMNPPLLTAQRPRTTVLCKTLPGRPARDGTIFRSSCATLYTDVQWTPLNDFSSHGTAIVVREKNKPMSGLTHPFVRIYLHHLAYRVLSQYSVRYHELNIWFVRTTRSSHCLSPVPCWLLLAETDKKSRVEACTEARGNEKL